MQVSEFDDLTKRVQQAPDTNAVDLVFRDVEHAKSSGQITEEEYLWLCDYAYKP